MRTIRVTVWNEFFHEREAGHPARTVYPDGMHAVIASALGAEPDLAVRTATLAEPEHGLTPEALAQTDVLTWWGHARHRDVSDAVVDRVVERVVQHGMGFIALHSAHYSKVFRRLMGTSCSGRSGTR